VPPSLSAINPELANILEGYKNALDAALMATRLMSGGSGGAPAPPVREREPLPPPSRRTDSLEVRCCGSVAMTMESCTNMCACATCVTTNQPDTKSNPNPNITAKRHAIVSIHLNIVTSYRVQINSYETCYYCIVCTSFSSDCQTAHCCQSAAS